MRFWLAGEEETRAAGAALAPIVVSMARAAPVVVFIRGNLGAGKSTLVRGLLAEIGVKGVMPSPTYTLVEPYRIGTLMVFHMDAYRLADGAELDYLGLDDINEPGSVLLVEWPDHVSDALPEPSITVDLEVAPCPYDIDSGLGGENTRVPDAGRERDDSEATADRLDVSSNPPSDPGRLLAITVCAMPSEERERLLSPERWSMLTRVVT